MLQVKYIKKLNSFYFNLNLFLVSSNETEKVTLKKTDNKNFDKKSIKVERSENLSDCVSINSFSRLSQRQISNKNQTNIPATKLSLVNSSQISNKSKFCLFN